MSISIALQTALSGLTATQTALRTTADNISNANTEGFTRKTVDLQSRRILDQGAGVQASAINRIADEFVISQIRNQLSQVGEQNVLNRFLQQIQDTFGTPENNQTIASSINELKNALETVALTPEFAANSLEVANIAQQLSQFFNQLSTTTQALRSEADTEIARLVDTVEDRLKAVAELNQQIARATTLQQPAAALRDERDRALAAIAEHIDIHAVDQSDGTTTVFTAGGALLVNGGIARDLDHTAAAQLAAGVSYLDPSDPNYPGPITGIFVGGSTAPADDITNDISGGSIGALIALRDTILPNLQSEIDNLAHSLTTEFNRIHNTGTAYPPPQSLTGSFAFTGGDVFSATGSVRVAVLSQLDGTVVETLDIALGGFTSVNDVVAAINGMTNASATLNAQGQLVVSANAGGQGIAINELDSAVTAIGAETRGLSHFFGLNDLFQSAVGSSDYNAFATNQVSDSTVPLGLAGTLTFAANGLSTNVGYAAGDSLDAIAVSINANGALAGANITARVADDGSGRRLVIEDADNGNFVVTDSGTFLSSTGAASSTTGASTVLAVQPDIAGNPSRLARAQLNNAAGLAVGDSGVAAGDATTASALAGLFDSNVSFSASGGAGAATTTLARYATTIISIQATMASSTSSQLGFDMAFLDTLEFRNASVSGVNIDEELANLVILEQAFNASARVVTVASQMFEELLNIAR
ncbi:MAG: flagellar hook-associated protein FlgK [Alphaproteobacteria bacterium]|nr:flagellar hook-associated protein FlgK [Alphaproteobacteria bacterium]